MASEKKRRLIFDPWNPSGQKFKVVVHAEDEDVVDADPIKHTQPDETDDLGYVTWDPARSSHPTSIEMSELVLFEQICDPELYTRLKRSMPAQPTTASEVRLAKAAVGLIANTIASFDRTTTSRKKRLDSLVGTYRLVEYYLTHEKLPKGINAPREFFQLKRECDGVNEGPSSLPYDLTPANLDSSTFMYLHHYLTKWDSYYRKRQE